MSAEEFNLEERVLCSDDTCIGLVGPDGRCKECGKPYESEEQEGNRKEQEGNGKEEIAKRKEETGNSEEERGQ